MSTPATTNSTSPPTPTPDRYPLRLVVAGMALVLFISIIASFIIDSVYADYYYEQDPRYGAFRGVCYWVGDARTLNRISLYGYTDYLYDSAYPHLTNLPDRSWWPVFPFLTHLMIDLTGDGVCSGWTVNALAVVLLVPVLQAITGTRRLMHLVGLTLIPFGLWLYVGMAEGVFLLFSALLWLVTLQAQPNTRRRNAITGLGALLLGVLVGLTKPNSIALMPAFLTMGVVQGWRFIRQTRESAPDTAWPALLNDANPGWIGLIATAGIALGNGLWFYQTSGYYPFYVLLAQRTLWFKQFYPGDLGTMLEYFSGGVRQAYQTGLDAHGLERMMRLQAPILLGALALQDLRPRWPGSKPRRVPLYARVSLLAVLGLMFLSGQAHAITRYAMGNIFFIVLYLQYVYGDDDAPPLWRLPGIWLRGKPGAFSALLRLVMFILGPLLTITVLLIGPDIGI